ncbi:glycosyltransferase [Flammeovirga sp. EKP202]|uniref:glycosyltransferase n=1 Tax=Flammeovirga sp. EKP202 TaxID=2770592 RepID=UPI00165EEA4F|nr:glycosyltransferase [Flammeovirga sp. EKP202]MBD0401315.1 glycosyltransferase [Flammeovirga sp. EKP202]
MKIVHISTYPNGGAGNATIRMHKSLLENGVDSKVITRDYTLDNEGVKAFNTSVWFRKVSTLWKMIKILPNTYKAEPDCEGFSSPMSLYHVHKHEDVKEADVVIIQWVSNFLDYSTFFEKIDKPVYLYLHDMNHFHGGFHYSEDVERFIQYEKLESLFKEIKRKAYAGKDIEVLAPSQWMIDLSQKSELLGAFPHHKMFYGLDPQRMKYHEQSVARTLFNLPEHGRVLLFVSERISNRRKGATLLIEALKKVKFSENISILVVGNYDKSIFDAENVFTTGVLKSEKEMSMAYSASDLFILPSLEDNMPNVMLESLYCGTPVMSFSNGGMKEIINDTNGIIISEIGVDALAEGIQQWVDHPPVFERKQIRKDITETFNLKARGEALKTLINKRLQTI